MKGQEGKDEFVTKVVRLKDFGKNRSISVKLKMGCNPNQRWRYELSELCLILFLKPLVFDLIFEFSQ